MDSGMEIYFKSTEIMSRINGKYVITLRTTCELGLPVPPESKIHVELLTPEKLNH